MAAEAVPVVTLENNHKYKLNLESLRNILENEQVKNLPVTVVSVVGAYRTGKSFLLNYFIRYLKADQKTKEDGTWLESNAALQGFSWRGGSERNTTGILIWSEPFICTTKSGEKTAIILMDTQGTFDASSSVRECSIIVALSTLLSSIQIYNISLNLKEDDLQFLQLFTEYGKLLTTEGDGAKPFQVLEFLIRDWMFPYEYSYGAEGGKLFIDKKLEPKANQPKELQEVHAYIKSCFEKVSCFLMPHPGFAVMEPKFNGNTHVLSAEFKNFLRKLATSVFGPENLHQKRINGNVVQGRELCTYFQTYMELFNSDQLPTPMSILNATAEAELQLALTDARAVYEKEMQEKCKESMSSSLLHNIHLIALETARNTFINKKKMASKEACQAEQERLSKELDSRLADYSTINVSKTYTLMNEANAAYDRVITDKKNGKLFCTHPANVSTVHNEAVAKAKSVFMSKRRYSENDTEMEDFFKTFNTKLSQLMISNEENNRVLVSQAKGKYWDEMYSKVNQWPPLSRISLNNYHLKAAEDTKTQFKIERIASNEQSNDKYFDDLEQSINSMYRNIESINDNQLEKERLVTEEMKRNRREKERAAKEKRKKKQKAERERMEREQRRNQEYYTCSIL